MHNPLARYLETGEPCEVLGLRRFVRRGPLLYAIRTLDGTVIGCGGREIERWSADVVPFVRSASPGVLRTAGEIAPVSPANPLTR